MLNNLKIRIAASALGSVLKSLATSKNTQTSITGMIAGAVLAVSGLDLRLLLQGDPVQIAHVVAGVLLMVIGILATRKGHDGSTTMLGVIAGVLQASSGQVQDLTVGVIITVLGHLTNKPTMTAAIAAAEDTTKCAN
jgi:uncharacterized membrane protein